MATEKEFWELAESWNERTYRLKNISMDDRETNERRYKAFRLCIEMANRMVKVIEIGTRLRRPKPLANFKVGGVIGKVKTPDNT